MSQNDDFLEGMALSPFLQFSRWYDEANAAVPTANAMSLATVGKSGLPRVRIVLLKGASEKGFVFFTNYSSQKAKDLEFNPLASVCFHWDILQKQIRIEGSAAKVSRSESEAYFATRSRESQIGAWASHQSEVLAHASELQERVLKYEKKFQGQTVPCPDHWGGFLLTPALFEFWHGRSGRLHDRLRYVPQSDGSLMQPHWRRELLNP